MSKKIQFSIPLKLLCICVGLLMLTGLCLGAVAEDEASEHLIGSATRVPEEFAYIVPKIDTGPYRLYGTVLDQEGNAAAGIKVAAFRGEAWQWGYKDTITGEDGSYEITGLPEGAYHLSSVSVEALDVRPISLGDVYFHKEEGLRQDLALRPFDPDPLEGTVISKSGEPVPDALVLSIAGWGSYGMGLALQVRTDEAGRFKIPRYTWRPGDESRLLLSPTLAAFAEGHEPGVLLGKLPEGEPLTLTLDQGVRVSGTVRFKNSGESAPHIPVMLRGTPADNDLPDIITRTNASGAFVFDNLCPFQYQLVIYNADEGYTALEHPRLNLLDGEDEDGLEMQISHGATISGKVTIKETGEPIPGVRLWIPNVRPPRVLRGAVTGADGTYRLDHLPSGEFSVAYAVPDGVVHEFQNLDNGPLVAEKITVGPDEQRIDVDFTFERGACVSGRVLDEAGDPVEGVRVSATNFHHVQRPSRHLVTSETKTAADGAYRLCGIAPSEEWTYQLTLSAGGYGRIESEPICVTGDISNQNFVAKDCATISGRVVDTDGNPVPTVAISLKPVEGNPPQRLPGTVSDAEGHFTMTEGAYPGTYTFELTTLHFGFGPYRRVEALNAPLEITGPNDIEELELVLPANDAN